MDTNKLLDIIAQHATKAQPDNITKGHLCYLRDEPDQFLRLTEPEPLLGAKEPKPKLLLSACLEQHRDYGYDRLRSYRQWISASFLVKGVPVTISFPLLITDTGHLDDTGRYSCSKEEVLEAIKHHRPRKPLPFDLDDKSVVWKDTSLMDVRGGHRFAEWTTPGRPVATLNAMLKRCGYTTLDREAGEAMLTEIDELVIAMRAEARWYDGAISDCYNENGHAPYDSCMQGKPRSWFELYDHMQQHDQLKLMELTRDGEHIGRALVWFGTNPDDLYIDRVYAPNGRSTWEPDVVAAGRDFCVAEGIRKTVYSQTAERIPGLEYTSKFRIKVAGHATPGRFEAFPYVDSMRNFGFDGYLRHSNSSGHHCLCMEDTEGGGDHEDYVTLANGDRVHQDVACYSEITEERYSRDEVTWSDYHDTWIPDGDVVETYDGHTTYSDNSDLLTLHNGDYAFDDDSNIVELRNGGHAQESECTELHDGTYMLENHSDLRQLHDGEYAHDSEVVELHDGEFALANDETVAMHEGQWYLLADVPENEEETAEATA